jgi:hypothetical protein
MQHSLFRYLRRPEAGTTMVAFFGALTVPHYQINTALAVVLVGVLQRRVPNTGATSRTLRVPGTDLTPRQHVVPVGVEKMAEFGTNFLSAPTLHTTLYIMTMEARNGN